MNAHLPQDAYGNPIKPPPEFWLMYASLLKTDIYNAIEKRLGRGLIAQSKVSQFFSDALGDHHWVDEVERLVATMHARTQINAWSIASGEDSIREGKDGYTLITPKDIYGNLCGMFKYNPPGYVSIRFWPFMATLSSFFVFLLLSRKWPLWPFWSNETPDPVRVEPQPPDTGVAGQEEPTPPPDHTRPTGSETEETIIGESHIPGGRESSSASMPPDSGNSGQEPPTGPTDNPVDLRSEIEGTIAGPDDDASESGSVLANVPLDSGPEQPTAQPADSAAAGSETEETAAGVVNVSGPNLAPSANVPPRPEQTPSQTADSAATGGERGQITTGAASGAQAAGPPSANVPSDSAGQDALAPSPVEEVVSQTAQTGGATTGTPIDDSTDIVWEPLIFEKFIGGVWWVLKRIKGWAVRT